MRPHQRRPLEKPTFGQVIAILRDVLLNHPTDDRFSQIELAKRRHRQLGFQYHNEQLHRADDALWHLAQRSSSHWSSTSREEATRQRAQHRRGRK